MPDVPRCFNGVSCFFVSGLLNSLTMRDVPRAEACQYPKHGRITSLRLFLFITDAEINMLRLSLSAPQAVQFHPLPVSMCVLRLKRLCKPVRTMRVTRDASSSLTVVQILYILTRIRSSVCFYIMECKGKKSKNLYFLYQDV